MEGEKDLTSFNNNNYQTNRLIKQDDGDDVESDLPQVVDQKDEGRRHSAHDFPTTTVNVKALASLFQKKLQASSKGDESANHPYNYHHPHLSSPSAATSNNIITKDESQIKVRLRKISLESNFIKSSMCQTTIDSGYISNNRRSRLHPVSSPSDDTPSNYPRESRHSMDDISKYQLVEDKRILSNSSENLPVPRPRLSVMRKKWTNDILFFDEKIFDSLPDDDEDELYMNEPHHPHSGGGEGDSSASHTSSGKACSQPNQSVVDEELYEIPNDCDSSLYPHPYFQKRTPNLVTGKLWES